MSQIEAVMWSRVRDVLLGWPGERGMTEKTWGGYFDGLSSWSDPIEVEEVLRAMRDNDERGQRPPLGTIRRALIRHRERKLIEARRRHDREWGRQGNPPPDLDSAPNEECRKVLTHAALVGYSIAPAAVVRWHICTDQGFTVDGMGLGIYAGLLWAAHGGFSEAALYGDPGKMAAWTPPYSAVWPGEVEHDDPAEVADGARDGAAEIASWLRGFAGHDARVKMALAALVPEASYT